MMRDWYETKFTSMEKERSDAMEMATQAYEERKTQTTEEVGG